MKNKNQEVILVIGTHKAYRIQYPLIYDTFEQNIKHIRELIKTNDKRVHQLGKQGTCITARIGDLLLIGDKLDFTENLMIYRTSNDYINKGGA